MKLDVICTAQYADMRNGRLIFDSPEAIKKQIEILQGALDEREQRLEFYEDGIYLDGKRLEIKGLAERFLREFEGADEVSETTLAYHVWSDSTKSREAIYEACKRLRNATGIWIERDGSIYRIDRPK